MADINTRAARFHCIIVYLRHARDPSPLIAQGTWEGVITREPRGESGFGYDPVFIPEGENRTFAEISPAEKNAISHRGIAVRRMVETLLASQ